MSMLDKRATNEILPQPRAQGFFPYCYCYYYYCVFSLPRQCFVIQPGLAQNLTNRDLIWFPKCWASRYVPAPGFICNKCFSDHQSQPKARLLGPPRPRISSQRVVLGTSVPQRLVGDDVNSLTSSVSQSYSVSSLQRFWLLCAPPPASCSSLRVPPTYCGAHQGARAGCSSQLFYRAGRGKSRREIKPPGNIRPLLPWYPTFLSF